MLKLNYARAVVIVAILGFALLPCVPAHASLLAYWNMDSTSGTTTTAADQSGNNLTAVLVGDATRTAGRFGQAVSLSGTSSPYVNCGSDAKLDLGTNDYTMSFWFKGAPKSDWRWLLSYNGMGSALDPALVITTIYVPEAEVGPGSRLRVSQGSWCTDVNAAWRYTVKLDSSEDWYHVALTRSGTTLTEYVNGASIFSTPTNPSVGLVLNADLLLGNCGGNYFSGAMDDVAIWNQALSAGQIAALADGSQSPLTIPEPSAVLLLMAGVGLVSGAWRKRN